MVTKFVAGQEKFFVTALGALQALLAADVFGLDPSINTGLIGLIVPMIAWLTANTKLEG